MPSNHYRCVIDSYGNYVAVVLMIDNMPFSYGLKSGEKTIEAIPPTQLKPRWDGSKWIETATASEIEADKPEPIPYVTYYDRLQAMESALLVLMMGDM